MDAPDVEQRELYFRRIEEFLDQSLKGKLDAGALIRRELELEQLKKLLEQRQAQLELALRERSRALEQSHEARTRALEQEHLTLMASAREREFLLKSEEKALAERQAQFQDYYAAQRAELQSQLKHFRAEIEAEVRFRSEVAERMLEQRHASLEGGWQRERELLVRELESWKLKAQELAPRVLELERRLAAAEEATRQARSASDAKTLVFEEQRRGFDALKTIWEDERRLLKEELERWRAGGGRSSPQS